MPISNADAYRLLQQGRSVIVECADCGEKIWTRDGHYLAGADEWTCDDCEDERVEDVLEEMADDLTG